MVTRLKGNVTGRLYIVTAEKIPSSELMDTTGAGDAFTGGLLYGNNILYAKCIKPNLTEFYFQYLVLPKFLVRRFTLFFI